jgi:hypothetical protein
MGKNKKQQSSAKKAARMAEIVRGILIAKGNQITVDDLTAGPEGLLRPGALAYHCKGCAALQLSAVLDCKVLSAAAQAQMFALVEQNMQSLYEAAGEAMPWNPKEKRQVNIGKNLRAALRRATRNAG